MINLPKDICVRLFHLVFFLGGTMLIPFKWYQRKYRRKLVQLVFEPTTWDLSCTCPNHGATELSKIFQIKPNQAFSFSLTYQKFPSQDQLVLSAIFYLDLFWKNYIIYYPVFPCISTEEIMAAKIAEVINWFTISASKISVGEQSTLSV